MNPTVPRRCNPVAKLLGGIVLSVFGWQKAGQVPNARNVVIIAAPHTTNWDFIFLLATAYSFGISVNWLGKDSLFLSPLGPILRFLGGVPVDRSKRNNLVQSLSAQIEHGSGIALVIPPSGTRQKTEHWKSGFYRIAEAAQIPLVCGYLDYRKKEAGLGLTFMPSDLSRDMDKIRAFYEPIVGKYPENQSRIRLREEDQ